MDKQEFIKLYADLEREINSPTTNLYNGWHSAYTEFENEVNSMREELNNRELHRHTDEAFLKDLFYKNAQAVATAGRGRIRDEGDFFDLIDDIDVLIWVKHIIREPNAKNAQDLFNAVKRVAINRKHKAKNKYLITNRVVAACTLDVSSTVDRNRFTFIFDFLVNWKILDNHPDRLIPYIGEAYGKPNVMWKGDRNLGTTEWYNENYYLIKEIKKMLLESGNKKIDRIQLSMFPWYIWDKKLAPEYTELYPELFPR